MVTKPTNRTGKSFGWCILYAVFALSFFFFFFWLSQSCQNRDYSVDITLH